MDQSAIDVPMPIRTTRLILRPAQEGDGQAVYDAKLESWDELFRWSIWTFKPREEMTAQEDELSLLSRRAMFVKRTDIVLLAFDRKIGGFIGVGGLHKCDWVNRIFSLGFWIRSRETGKGYASEIAQALSRYAFEALGAKKLVSMHAQGNDGSRRVLEKTGFTCDEILPACHMLADGRMVDEHRYSLGDADNLKIVDVSWGSG
jgi:RimJ/RimL family protein N-acetyltransferase